MIGLMKEPLDATAASLALMTAALWGGIAVAVKYSGKQIATAFNPDFLIEPLRNLTSDEVYLELVDDMSPVVIKTETPFLYVLMPLRMS